MFSKEAQVEALTSELASKDTQLASLTHQLGKLLLCQRGQLTPQSLHLSLQIRLSHPEDQVAEPERRSAETQKWPSERDAISESWLICAQAQLLDPQGELMSLHVQHLAHPGHEGLRSPLLLHHHPQRGC